MDEETNHEHAHEHDHAHPHEEENKGMNTYVILGVLAVVIIGAAVVLLGGKKSAGTSDAMEQKSTQTSESPAPTSAVEGASTATSETTTDADVQTITVEAGSFYYKPNVMTVKKGKKVKVVMTSKDMMHDFNIDELKVKLPITKSGETNTVEFTPDKAGTFEYYCSVGQHRAKGQVGKITVEE